MERGGPKGALVLFNLRQLIIRWQNLCREMARYGESKFDEILNRRRQKLKGLSYYLRFLQAFLATERTSVTWAKNFFHSSN